MSFRPTEIPEGAIRFNTDSSKMELWIGEKWMIVSTSLPVGIGTSVAYGDTHSVNSAGHGRGLLCGGNASPAYTEQVDMITIPTQGNATDFANMTDGKYGAGTCSSSIRAVQMGGYNGGNTNVIEFITFSTQSNAANFGDLGTARRGTGAVANETRGVAIAGTQHPTSPNKLNIIEFVTIATEGDAVDFGDTNQVGNNMGAAGSPTRGVIAANSGPGSPISGVVDMQFITIPTTGNAQDFGSLTQPLAETFGCSNATRALFGGGMFPSPEAAQTRIDYCTIATTGGAVFFGDLTRTRQHSSACSSAVRGVWMGGVTHNVIDYVTIATLGDAIDFGDLVTARWGGNQAASNSHGGL